jgi:site-specific DNA recombinase
MKAVIYCRVSTDRQATEGHGLEGQERRCRTYAKQKGYEVLKVFREEGVSGGITDRPEMQKMLMCLREIMKKGEKTVVIIDDIKRLARDIEGHFHLKAAIVGVNGVIESPSHTFEDTPEGKFVETIMASTAELERNQNKAQVKNRMKARLEAGYWTFYAPPAYKNAKDEKEGKIIVPVEPDASILKRALEGFAEGIFQTQSDVQKFLQANGFEGRASVKRTGKVHLEAVKRLLRNDIYAGFITCEDLGVIRAKGKHEPIITPETYFRIQERLENKVRSHIRQDVREDFPLRGSVICEHCGRRLTAAWTTGRDKKKFPYYRCLTPKCIGSISKDTFESEFERALKKYKPFQELIDLLEAVLRNVHNQREEMNYLHLKNAQEEILKVKSDLKELIQIAGRTTKDSVREMYEEQIEELCLKRKALEKKETKIITEEDFYTAFQTGKGILKNPLETWQKGHVKQKISLQTFVFRDKLFFSKENSFGNSEYSLLYNILQDSKCNESHLVEVAGIEPASGKGRRKASPITVPFRVQKSIKTERKTDL